MIRKTYLLFIVANLTFFSLSSLNLFAPEGDEEQRREEEVAEIRDGLGIEDGFDEELRSLVVDGTDGTDAISPKLSEAIDERLPDLRDDTGSLRSEPREALAKIFKQSKTKVPSRFFKWSKAEI